MIIVTECRNIENNKNTSIISTSRNSGKLPSILGSISPRSNYYECERNLQDVNINFARDKKDTSQRHLLVHSSTSVHESRNSANNELSYPCATDADKSPQQMKADIKNCFGFEESDSEEEEPKYIETNRNPSFQDFSDISPVHRAGLFSPKHKPDGYLNSTRASVISPTGPKLNVLRLGESRIISGNFAAPFAAHFAAVERSRYTSKKKKGAIPDLPSSAYAYSFSTKNANKSVSTKVETNTLAAKKRNDTNHNSDHERFRVVSPLYNENKYCTGIASKEHEADNNLIPLNSNIMVSDKNKRDRSFNDRKRVPQFPESSNNKRGEGTVINKNTLAVLKENTENNSSGGKASKQTKRNATAINKPSKIQKQTLVYETIGVKRQLKAPISLKKSNIRYVILNC